MPFSRKLVSLLWSSSIDPPGNRIETQLFLSESGREHLEIFRCRQYNRSTTRINGEVRRFDVASSLSVWLRCDRTICIQGSPKVGPGLHFLHSRLGESLGLPLPCRTHRISQGCGDGSLACETERENLTVVSNLIIVNDREEFGTLAEVTCQRRACVDNTDRFQRPPVEELQVRFTLARGAIQRILEK